MDPHQLSVITHFHQTFASMRVATANRCPAGSTVEIIGISSNHSKILISFKDSPVLQYSVRYVDDRLVERLLSYQIESVELIASSAYALKFVEMASQLVRSHNDYPK